MRLIIANYNIKLSDYQDVILKRIAQETEREPQAVIDEWIADDPEVKILVLDKGNKIAVYAY